MHFTGTPTAVYATLVQRPTGGTELVSDDFPVLHAARSYFRLWTDSNQHNCEARHSEIDMALEAAVELRLTGPVR